MACRGRVGGTALRLGGAGRGHARFVLLSCHPLEFLLQGQQLLHRLIHLVLGSLAGLQLAHSLTLGHHSGEDRSRVLVGDGGGLGGDGLRLRE